MPSIWCWRSKSAKIVLARYALESGAQCIPDTICYICSHLYPYTPPIHSGWGYLSSLRKLPGPWIARFTRLFLVRQAAKGNANAFYHELHRNYGPIDRIAPNKISTAHLSAIPVIYGVGSKYYKV